MLNVIWDRYGWFDAYCLFEKWTMQGLLDELDTIELFEAPGHGRVLGEVTKKQEELYTALGVIPPSL